MVTVTFILFTVKTNKHKNGGKRQYIEHTPVYKDDQQQCSKPIIYNNLDYIKRHAQHAFFITFSAKSFTDLSDNCARIRLS